MDLVEGGADALRSASDPAHPLPEQYDVITSLLTFHHIERIPGECHQAGVLQARASLGVAHLLHPLHEAWTRNGARVRGCIGKRRRLCCGEVCAVGRGYIEAGAVQCSHCHMFGRPPSKASDRAGWLQSTVLLPAAEAVQALVQLLRPGGRLVVFDLKKEGEHSMR